MAGRGGAGRTWRAGLRSGRRAGPPAAHARPRAPPPWRRRRPVSRGWWRRLPLRKLGLRLLPPTPPALRRRRRRRQRRSCLSATSTAASDPRPALLAGRGTVVVDARPCLREGEFPPGGGGGPSFSPPLPRPGEGRVGAPPATWPTTRARPGGPRSASLLGTPRHPPRHGRGTPPPGEQAEVRGGQEKRRPGRGQWGSVRTPRLQAIPRPRGQPRVGGCGEDTSRQAT